jgi:hypothetical protein
VFPVRYGLNVYILFGRNAVFKRLSKRGQRTVSFSAVCCTANHPSHNKCYFFQIVLCAIAACAFAKPGLLATGALGYAAPAIAAPSLAASVAYAAPAVAGPVAYAAPAVAGPVAYAAPAVAGPVAYAAPAVAAPVSVKTQYHAQDELGQASYGHAEPFQTHNAIQVRTVLLILAFQRAR